MTVVKTSDLPYGVAPQVTKHPTQDGDWDVHLDGIYIGRVVGAGKHRVALDWQDEPDGEFETVRDAVERVVEIDGALRRAASEATWRTLRERP